MSAATVAPTAWPAAASGGTELEKATRKALAAIPGQTRPPYARNAASAMP